MHFTNKYRFRQNGLAAMPTDALPEHNIHRVLGNQARNAFRALETCPSSNNAIALVSGTDLY